MLCGTYGCKKETWQSEWPVSFSLMHTEHPEVVFAKALARAQVVSEIRDYLLEEARNDYFGGYVVFWKMAKDEVIYNNQTFAELLTYC